MDSRYSAAHESFRAAVREFIAGVFPDPPDLERDGMERWSKALIAKGWQAYNWAPEYGGMDWDVTQKFIWETETSAVGLPAKIHGAGVSMLGPILYGYGNDEQRARFLPRILDGSEQWCQGYSEPGAGSDLASLSTKAVREGDNYRISGQKIWTSGAHKSDWMFCLVRTNNEGRKQAGISFVLIDMKSPGITVEPIISIDGDHTLNGVRLEDVIIPTSQLIGEENKGWTYAKGLLTHERTGLAFVSLSQQKLGVLKGAAEQNGLAMDAAFQQKVLDIETELAAIATTELRVLALTAQGAAPDLESSLLKLKGTQIVQRITELLIECMDYHGVPYPLVDHKPDIDRFGPRYAQLEMSQYLIARSASIAGGSDEVQYNIIAKHVLGL